MLIIAVMVSFIYIHMVLVSNFYGDNCKYTFKTVVVIEMLISEQTMVHGDA
jgi:hypothetical protein